MLSSSTTKRLGRVTIDLARRSKSSSVFADYIPDSFRNVVKESALEEITKDDSKLWGQNGLNGHNTPPRHGGINDTISIGLEDDLLDWHLDVQPRYTDIISNNADPFILSKPFLERLDESIRNDLVATDHPVLQKAASYFFSTASSGKKVRPMMVLLLSQALKVSDNVNVNSSDKSNILNTSRLEEQQYRLAEISEMIHTASLFHDDVIDGADTRRGEFVEVLNVAYYF